MKKLLLLSFLACGTLGTARAQQLVSQAELVLESRPAKPVICYARNEDMHTYVAPPAQFLNRTAGRPTADRARIEVTYIGFPADARAAFQKAVDIWQSLLFSPVVIRVEARWEALDEGVLGAAGATQIYRNLPGAPKSNIWYPVALAEKIAGQELNGTNADISAEFSSNFDWYLGLDGLPPAGKYDLVSVVLHELGHGLGFVAASSYTDPPPVTGPIASLNSSGFPGFSLHTSRMVRETGWPATAGSLVLPWPSPISSLAMICTSAAHWLTLSRTGSAPVCTPR
ncbi:hypothetical protein H9L05_09485 [Hymenobacter qilianensis]|uniref:Matrixin family metalloprotease n=1 Tax=Hymenobacter qilianensis TaxID=1385715 RepID=A0A7H0GZM8_9BACT|nr:hypothetical protein [Hymenobacter qilianensis]QNP53744.1 hypothetical protein H9L05_09485 [Hymenobacter qilianensis]